MEALTFKQIIHRDIKQTFLNLDEFGEEHEVNGRTVVVIRQKFLFIQLRTSDGSPARGSWSRWTGRGTSWWTPQTNPAYTESPWRRTGADDQSEAAGWPNQF